jgi:transposase-like protein
MDERREAKEIEAAAGPEGARSAIGGVAAGGGAAAVEVEPKAKRRRFSAEYKARILREADACAGTGGLGALLRREGLYSSHLTEWRRLRARAALQALAARKRGRKPVRDVRDRELARLVRENARLRRKLAQAEAVIEVQKKLSEILGIPLESEERSESEE